MKPSKVIVTSFHNVGPGLRIMKPLFARLIVLTSSLGIAAGAFGQLQWSSYNTSGTRVSASAGTGGDAAYGGAVTFTIPASTTYTFITTNFNPVTLAASQTKTVTFTMVASGGFGPAGTPIQNQRFISYGMFNYGVNAPGASGNFTDDVGLWTDSYQQASGIAAEVFGGTNTMANLLGYANTRQLGAAAGPGTGAAGQFTDGTLTRVTFRMVENASGTASIGTGTATNTAGAWYSDAATGGTTFNRTIYSAGAVKPNGAITFNEFGFMFFNSKASSVTLTLSNLSLVPANPVITTPPASYSGSPGDSPSFFVTVSSNSATPLAYQWYNGATALTDGATGNGSTVAGATTSNLTYTSAQIADSGNLTVVVTNGYGATTSSIAVLTITSSTTPPGIANLTNQTVVAGNNATIGATVTGTAPALRWLENGTPISGATSNPLILTSVQYAQNGYIYSLVASNSAGVVTNSMTLSVIVTPSISVQPVSVTVSNGQPASFSVTASGVPAPVYQWRRNGAAIPNATNTTYALGSVTLAETGNYTVLVTNVAGSVTSSNATLAVYSTMGVTTLAPSNNASGLCYDTPLYVTFSVAPTLRTPGTGKIRIFNSANSVTPVDTLDMSANASPHSTYAANVQARTNGTVGIATYPVIITGNTAAIYPRPGVMTSNQTYYVIVDNGVFTDAAGAWQVGVTGTNDWRFTTKTTVSATATTNPIVNADGSGDFATIQGALDHLPASGSNRRLIEIRNGNYTEVVVIAKSNVTLRGQSRLGAKQQYYNNNWMNASTRTRMSFHVRAPDVAIESMTLTNMTPKGGSQAEALFLESGSAAAKRFVLLNCLVTSYQDTILGNDSDTPAYFANSTIQGDTDYIWGGATMFFTNCELKMLSTGGQYANPSSSAGSNGIAFVGCTLTRAAGVTTAFLGRTRSITNGNTAFINCTADSHVSGWQSDALPTNSYRLWHYGVSNLTATVNRDATITNSILLTAGDPRLTLALNATSWLYGWVPQLAPNILTNPANQYVTTGGTASLGVTATGIPEPAYQWQKNGTNVPGANSATLSIPGAVPSDSGSYSVIVSSSAGTVTSSTATLTVNTAPVANNVPASTTVNTPLLLLASKVLLYCSDADANTLTLTSVSATSTNGGTATLSLGTITYTPVANFIGVDQFNYTISDGNGGAATSTVTVTVTASGVGFNQLSVQVVGPDVVLTYLGIPALNYALDRTFNLTPPVTWVPQITNPAAFNGAIIFTNTPNPSTNNFWRTRHVP